jgi:hypothetical protein
MSKPSKFQDFKRFKLDHTMFSCKATFTFCALGNLINFSLSLFCILLASEDETYFYSLWPVYVL